MSATADNSDLAGVQLIEPVGPIPRKISAPGGAAFALGAIPIEDIGGITMGQLATLNRDPSHPLAQKITASCSRGCGATFEVMRLFAAVTACDECCAAAEKEERLRRAKTYWESICPPQFRDTDRNHPEFPKAQYDALADYNGGQSLFLGGDARRGKTRLALILLKRCLVRYNQHVGVLWPEELKQVRSIQTDRLQWVQRHGRFDLLLLDDCLLTGAQDERITDALKDLIDYRMRWKRASIITSQITGEQFKEQAQKAGNVTATDLKRVEALMARIRETSRVVVFTSATATDGSSPF